MAGSAVVSLARGCARQAGATLVELVMTIVIISIAIAGVVGAFALIAGRSADPLNQSRAVALSQLYMDEILAQKYADGSPLGGGEAGSSSEADCGNIGSDDTETRATYDDVDDYDELSSAAPENNEEAPLTGYSGFSVSVSVVCAGTDVGFANDYEAKRIDITITDPSGNNYLFSGYRGNF
ncbi:type IV pilus modification PilV family protein [Marinobacter persicus]|uniref:MSHA pilin protein MshD n=1 Tax=Marinobacter persicus TaxID=930118 RepID=A0A2S6G4B0_9GAMM|nr:type II secretion system protein [Marinobacter persicus]KXS51629.1 MAG: MSHA pilin protein MshD [Marinobacter sp. T13-3]PPK51811.1 MSHA pilin protein MshD [Marinobacter persicus]PPK53935.1 MSHA pilin protein MshD [Marinobacter persicus]PPK58742.1 MSHA pilin protein MshD [Marinobacter persicus]